MTATGTRAPTACGTYRGYTIGGCRCPECTRASRDYNANRERQIAYGRWNPYTDAEPVREHLAILAESGIGARQAARLAGVPYATVSRALHSIGGAPQSKRIKTRSAVTLLAVRPGVGNLCARTPVVHLGCTRRVQSLAAAGFPFTAQARLSGVGRKAIQRAAAGALVYASTVHAVFDMFERLKGADPAAYGIDSRAVTYSRQRAAQAGWVTPARWESEIDDPSADPRSWSADDAVLGRAEDVVEDAEFIRETDKATWQHTAERLEVDVDTLHTYRTRVRERAAAPAAPEPT